MQFTRNRTEFDINDSNVKYIHLRWDNLESHSGGATICYYLDFETKDIYFNYSVCSYGDNFNRRIGREISLGRLQYSYVQVKLDKEIRYKNCCEAIENHFLKYTINDPEFDPFHDKFSRIIIGLFLDRKTDYAVSDKYCPFTYGLL